MQFLIMQFSLYLSCIPVLLDILIETKRKRVRRNPRLRQELEIGRIMRAQYK